MKIQQFQRMQRLIPAALVLGATFVTPVGASVPNVAASERAPAPSDGRNAALYYWRAFYTLDREFQKKSMDYLDSERTAQWKPSDTAITGLVENREFISQLLTASRIEKCDFGIAYEEGYLALLPHLGLMRSAARILVLDAHRLMADGKPDEAAERIAGIYRMATHLRSDNVLISGLVSVAIASLAGNEAEMFAKAGMLTDDGRSAIIMALQPLNQADGFGIKRSIDMERRIMVDYLRRKLTGPDAGKKLFDVGIVEASQEDKDAIMALDEAGAAKALDQMEVAYREVLAVWDSPDHVVALKRVATKIERNEFGPLAKVLTPALSHAKSSDAKSLDRLRDVLHTLSNARQAPVDEPGRPE